MSIYWYFVEIFVWYIDIIDTLNDVSMTSLPPALMSTKILAQTNSLVQTLIFVYLYCPFHELVIHIKMREWMLSGKRYCRHANSTIKARNINTSNVNTYVWGERKNLMQQSFKIKIKVQYIVKMFHPYIETVMTCSQYVHIGKKKLYSTDPVTLKRGWFANGLRTVIFK